MEDSEKAANPLILIAEDESARSGVLQSKLARHGFVVETAADGVEALAKMRLAKPSLVLLDLIMPNKNGFQVLEETRADPELKDIRIVIFSNLNQDEDRERARKLGALDFLVKSDLGINEVVGKVNAFLGRPPASPPKPGAW